MMRRHAGISRDRYFTSDYQRLLHHTVNLHSQTENLSVGIEFTTFMLNRASTSSFLPQFVKRTISTQLCFNRCCRSPIDASLTITAPPVAMFEGEKQSFTPDGIDFSVQLPGNCSYNTNEQVSPQTEICHKTIHVQISIYSRFTGALNSALWFAYVRCLDGEGP